MNMQIWDDESSRVITIICNLAILIRYIYISLLVIILLKGDLKPNIWTVLLLIVNFQYDLCGSPEAQRALQP